MKIKYQFTRLEFYKYLNQALGIWLKKRKIKQNRFSKLRTFSDFYIRNWLCTLILFPIIAFLDGLGKYDNILNFLIILFLFSILINGLFLIIMLKVMSMCYVTNEGEYTLTTKELIHTSNDRTIKRNWDTMELIVVLKEVIILYSKEKAFFIIKNEGNNEELICQAIKNSDLRTPSNEIFKLIQDKDINTNSLENYSYLLLILIIFSSGVIFWNNHNQKLLAREFKYTNIEDFKLDSNIYTMGKYQIIESLVKNNYIQFKNNLDIYNEYSAYGTFYLLNNDFLKETENVKELYDDLENRQNKASEALAEILRLTNENLAMFQIAPKNLGQFYEKTYHKYIANLANSHNLKIWEEENEINKRKNTYLKALLEILVKDDACWYIEDNVFYICNDEDLKNYSNYYELLKEVNNKVYI